MAYQPSQPRPPSSYDDQTGPFLNVGSTPVPEVTTYSPSRGSEGTKIEVYITSLYDLMTANLPTFYLNFGHVKCQASLTKMDQQGGVCQYMLATEVPPFASTAWTSSQVPIFLLMESTDGDIMAKLDVGSFSYVDASSMHNASQTTQDSANRKRKISADSPEMISPTTKRLSSQQLRPKEEYAAYSYSPVQTPTTGAGSYQSYLSPNPYATATPYGRSLPSYPGQTENRNVSYIYSPSNMAGSPATPRAPLPDSSSWSSYSSLNATGRSHGVPSNAGQSRPTSLCLFHRQTHL